MRALVEPSKAEAGGSPVVDDDDRFVIFEVAVLGNADTAGRATIVNRWNPCAVAAATSFQR